MTRVSAVFDDHRDAEKAVNWLRDKGVPNENISVLARTPSETEKIAERAGVQQVAKDAGSDVARGAGTGLAAGAAVGAIFELAAAAIPGAGPFLVAGALAKTLGIMGGGAAAGAIVGGTSGLIAGALTKWGLDKADADYYAREVERGATFIAVDLDGTPLTRSEVEDAFRRFHGRFSSGTATAGARY
jgi:Heat induced stress protein YflT domain